MISHIIEEHESSPSVFYYIPGFMDKKEQKDMLTYLDNNQDFVPNLKYNNKICRLQKWYQTEQKYFCPLWRDRFPQWESFEMDATITSLINKVQDFVQTIPNITIPQINSCLINKYPTGDNVISPHRDSELSFGEKPTIVGLSLGETRTIYFDRQQDKPNGSFSFDLESGSIFIMAGSSQKFYHHSLKRSSCKGVRYSLTFREFIL